MGAQQGKSERETRPKVEIPVVTEQPGGDFSKSPTQLDPLTLQKLSTVTTLTMVQGDFLIEAVTGGVCCPNTYIFSDRDKQLQVGSKMIDYPLFIAKEDSTLCCRCCCQNNAPLYVRLFHVGEAYEGKKCCGCTGPVQYFPDIQRGAVMTMERDGYCNKCLGCCVCGPRCQDEMLVHAGNLPSDPGFIGGTKCCGPPCCTPPQDKYHRDTYFARSQVPKWGGGCTPTTNITDRVGGPGTPEEQFGTVEGPTCFGGCKDLCMDTPFKISQTPGKSGNLGEIRKRRPKNCSECCVACCSDIDYYDINMANGNFTPEQKATVMASAIHLDYMFFEQDPPPVQVESDGKNTIIIITLCQWYCYGCIVPIQVCLAISSEG